MKKDIHPAQVVSTACRGTLLNWRSRPGSYKAVDIEDHHKGCINPVDNRIPERRTGTHKSDMETHAGKRIDLEIEGTMDHPCTHPHPYVGSRESEP